MYPVDHPPEKSGMFKLAAPLADEAIKYDTGKPMMHLLDDEAILLMSSPTDKVRQYLREQCWRLAYGRAAELLNACLPYPAMRVEVARVLTHGAGKYAPENWRKGTKWSRIYDAADRHLSAFERGETLDVDSGLPHLAHFGCCMMFLTVYQRDKLGENDL